jgi:hypothetical protein
MGQEAEEETSNAADKGDAAPHVNLPPEAVGQQQASDVKANHDEWN